MLIHMLVLFREIGFPQLFVYGGFLFISVYAYTSLMDLDEHAIWIEGLRCLSGLTILYLAGNWFMLTDIRWIVAAYLIFSLMAVSWFVTKELRGKSLTVQY